MSIRMMTRVWEHSHQKGSPLVALLAIADFADDSGRAYPSVETLSKKCRLSLRNTQYVLKQLEDVGELEIQRNQGPRGVNLFRLLFPEPGVQSPAPVQDPAEPDGWLDDDDEGVQSPAPVQPPAPVQDSDEGVQNPVKGGAESGKKGCNPLHPEPSVNPSVEPSESSFSAENGKPRSSSLKSYVNPQEQERDRNPTTETAWDVVARMCHFYERDPTGMRQPFKGQQIGCATRLIAKGWTGDEILVCLGYLRSEDWRKKLPDLRHVLHEIGNWDLAGRPKTAPRSGRNRGMTAEELMARARDTFEQERRDDTP